MSSQRCERIDAFAKSIWHNVEWAWYQFEYNVKPAICQPVGKFLSATKDHCHVSDNTICTRK